MITRCKRAIKVAFATSNSGVTHGHMISVSRAPWEKENEPFVDRNRDGRNALDEAAKLEVENDG